MTYVEVPGFDWTQPCCIACYGERYPNRTPVKVRDPKVEQCVYCAGLTRAGIYVRIDPREAPHPTLRK